MTLAKRVWRHPGSRAAAWLTLSSLLALTYGPQPVSAQEIEARSALILDFQDPAGGGLLGRAATSALYLAMTAKGYNVRSRFEVEEAVLRLGLREPFEPDEIRKLYRELDADMIVAGRVLRVEDQPGPPAWVHVDLQIEVYDGETGDLVNGSISEGFETAAGGGRALLEELRNQAMERAVAAGLDQIERRTQITAAVNNFQARTNEVLLNRGGIYGVRVGMLFDVFRPKADPADPARAIKVKVGRVRVTDVSTDEATGEVLQSTEGIRAGDELREVFVLPAWSPPQLDAAGQVTRPSRVERGGSPTGAIMGVLGAIGGLAAIALLLSMNENTNRDSPVVNAATGAYLRQSQPGVFPSIVVEWGDRDFSPPRNFIGGYLVYRGQAPAFAAVEADAIGAVTGTTPRTFSDDPLWVEINTVMPVQYLRREGEDVEDIRTELDMTIIHQSPQPGQTYFYKVRRVGPAGVLIPPDLIISEGGSSGFGRSRARAARARGVARGTILRTGSTIVRAEVRVPPAARRQVQNIPPGPDFDPTLNPQSDNDIDPDDDIGLSDASVGIGPVTYIVPPELLAPANANQAQRVDDINFQWQNQFGATEYVLQISESVSFGALTFQSQPIQTTAPTQQSFRYDSTKAGFVTLAPNTTYFWRVGARTTLNNQRAPEPNGYVFSPVFTFSTADQPPAAP